MARHVASLAISIHTAIRMRPSSIILSFRASWPMKSVRCAIWSIGSSQNRENQVSRIGDADLLRKIIVEDLGVKNSGAESRRLFEDLGS